MPGLIALKMKTLRPSLYSLGAQKTRVDAIDQIIKAIGRVVRPIHDLAFQASESIQIGYGIRIYAVQRKGSKVCLFVVDEMIQSLWSFAVEGLVF